MKVILSLIAVIALGGEAIAQGTDSGDNACSSAATCGQDPLLSSPPPVTPEVSSEGGWAWRHRKAIAYGSLTGIYGGFAVWSYFAWYRVPELPSFTWGKDGLFGQRTYAGGADKAGHLWATYGLARAGTELLNWSGWSRPKAALTSSALAFALFFAVEVKDGFYYQFSYGDLAGNTLGAALSAVLSIYPRLDEHFDFRVEYFPSTRWRKRLTDGDVDVAEDYSGQTYLAAWHPGAVSALRNSKYLSWTRFVDVVVGFETRGYKPDPPKSSMELDVNSQRLFLGVSLNAQGAIDWLLRGDGCARRHWRKALHGTFEVFNLPYSSAAVPGLDFERSVIR